MTPQDLRDAIADAKAEALHHEDMARASWSRWLELQSKYYRTQVGAA